MILPQPPPNVARPWWKRWRVGLYLALFGLTSAWLTAAITMRPTTVEGQYFKNMSVEVSGIWLGLLVLVGIAVGTFRRPFWRFPQARVLDGLIGVTLFTLATFAAIAFLGFACHVVTDR
jgi:hypothetical protein